MKKTVCGFLVGCLLLCFITQGFAQALQRRRAQTAARAAAAADAAARKANPTPDADIKGFWIVRSAHPAGDYTTMTLEEPRIESTGAISVPKYDNKVSGSRNSTWDNSQVAVRQIQVTTARLLVGRKLERGERAFIHLPLKVDFKERDASPGPIGDDRTTLGH
jgi:hypothetical protein